MPTKISERVAALVARIRAPDMYNRRQKIMRRSQGYVMLLVRALILIGTSYIILSPLIGIISNSVKHPQDVYNPLVYLIPENFTLDNLSMAFRSLDYASSMPRSLLFTLAMMALQIIISSLVGYGFARFRFPGREVLFALVIVTIVVPVQMYIVPLYIQFRYFNIGPFEFNLVTGNASYAPMTLLTLTGMGVRSGLYIYIFRQFFRGLPKEIEEAALIDGAGQFRTYAVVMMPNAVSSIITVAMFSFVWQYNDTYYTSLFMSSIGTLATRLTSLNYTVTTLEALRDPNHVQLIVHAGIMLMIGPILVLYLFMQRFFMEGIERSGIVG